MKKTIYIINALLFMGSCLLVTTTIPNVESNKVENKISYVNSNVVFKFNQEFNQNSEDIEDEVVPLVDYQDKNDESKLSEDDKNENELPIVEIPEESKETSEEVITNNSVIYQEVGSGTMSGYSAEYGNTYTKYGHNIKESVTYCDDTYGQIRIIAAGKEFPAGTIIRITTKGILGTFNAIVLDTGPNIGIDKKHTFDLLYEKHSDAWNNGVKKITYQVLRKGF